MSSQNMDSVSLVSLDRLDKPCNKCKYYRENLVTCYRPITGKDFIRGKEFVPINIKAQAERLTGECGKQGRYWIHKSFIIRLIRKYRGIK